MLSVLTSRRDYLQLACLAEPAAGAELRVQRPPTADEGGAGVELHERPHVRRYIFYALVRRLCLRTF